MPICSSYCANLPAYLSDACTTLADSARAAHIVLVKCSFDITTFNPLIAAQWNTQIANGNFVIVPDVINGQVPEATFTTGPGKGCQPVRNTGATRTIQWQDENTIDNTDFYNSLAKNNTTLVGYIGCVATDGNQYFWGFSNPVRFEPKFAASGSIEEHSMFTTIATWSGFDHLTPFLFPTGVNIYS